MRSKRWSPAAFAVALGLVAVAIWTPGASPASAQAFGPPMTVFGSVSDAAGVVPDNLVVEAYVDDRVCGRGLTQFTGEGDARVTVYYADVVSREQTSGCGSPGAEVRIRIGDRFAPQTTLWRAGPVQLDVTFGDATPAPIPTFTPTPTPGGAEPATPAPATPTPPGALASPSVSPSPSATATRTPTPTVTPTPTLAGSLATRPANGSAGTDDSTGEGGFPVWAIAVIGLGALVAVGGGVGYLMARGRRDSEDDL